MRHAGALRGACGRSGAGGRGYGRRVHKRADLLVHDDQPLNAEPPPEALHGPLTPVDAFYVRNHGSLPAAEPGALRLRVDGLVDRELELSLDQLRDGFAVREVEATLQCAGNRRTDLMAVRPIPGELPWGPTAIGTARWRGASLADVLAAAGVRDGAHHVAFLGGDEVTDSGRFGGSIPLEKARASEVLLAWDMDGEPLAPEHGAPLRALVPGYIGARSVKWLERVTVQAEPSDNHFQAVEYRLEPPSFPLGELAVNAAILAPAPDAVVPAGAVPVEGWALTAGPRTVQRVDVSGDGGGTWVQAELLDDQGPWAWRRWRAELDLAPGAAEIVARAWDSAANSQPDDVAAVWNHKGYANNACPRVRVQARA